MIKFHRNLTGIISICIYVPDNKYLLLYAKRKNISAGFESERINPGNNNLFKSRVSKQKIITMSIMLLLPV